MEGGGLCGNRIGRLQIRSFLFLCCFVGKAKSSTKKSGAKMKIINEAKQAKQEADEGKRREEYERTKSIPDKWKMLLISTLRFAPSS